MIWRSITTSNGTIVVPVPENMHAGAAGEAIHRQATVVGAP
ncbi:hypothetical protein [Methylobacterium nodulans]|nr:hypothetical protein [Methylobacterium nodulans]